MRHKHTNTIETNYKIQNSCINENKQTGKCEDTNTFPVALEVLKSDFETKIRENNRKLDDLDQNFNDLEKIVIDTDQKLGGGNEDNTILDDENTIKEIMEQFAYLKKTPDFISKIKDFLEKNSIFTTEAATETETDTDTDAAAKAAKVTKIKTDIDEILAEIEKEKYSPAHDGKISKDDHNLKEKKIEKLEEKKKELENQLKNLTTVQTTPAEKTSDIINTFEIKKIDNDMFISESELDKLKKQYIFNIDYYKSQAQFQQFNTQLNQLNDLKKIYQDLILKFEAEIDKFKNNRKNLEKLINTYFKNSLLKKREILTKFDNFIKNIIKNVNNIRDIPKNLIDYLTVKKISIQTSLIEKSFPDFKNPNNIDLEKLTISSEYEHDSLNNKVIFSEDNPKTFNITSITDNKDKTFNLEQRDRKIEKNDIKFTYKMTNSENTKYNHKLIITLKKDNYKIYKITKIQAEIDRNIQLEKRGGVGATVNNTSDAANKSPTKMKESPEIKDLDEVFSNLQKKNDFVIKQKIRDGVDVSGVNSKDIEKGDVGDDIIETLVLDYERKKQNVKTMDEKERIDREFLEKVNGLGLNLNEIFEVNLMDKFYFILYSLVLHIITYSIIESLIMSSNLNSLVSIMGIYSFLYVLLIILTLGIIHIYGYRGKVFLNYLNLDHNFYNIIGHFIIVAIFFGIILILSQYINTANIENEDERVKMLYRIEIITGVMFAFTTMFIVIL
tara:strand:+ start:923 stop:3103 length:2181 start_codon:yes stop_codon:yes gene_type:complete